MFISQIYDHIYLLLLLLLIFHFLLEFSAFQMQTRVANEVIYNANSVT